MHQTPERRTTTNSRHSTGSTVVSMRKMSAHKLVDVINSLQQKNASEEQIALTCGHAGNAFYRAGDYEQALEYFNHALAKYQELEGKEKEIIQILNQLGLVYTQQSNFLYAESSFRQVLEMLGDEQTAEKATTLSNFGQMYRKQGSDYPNAIELFNAALNIYKALKRQADIADMHRFLGMTYFAQKEYLLAFTELTQAFALYDGAQSDEAAETAYYLGLVYQAQGNDESAITQLQLAQTIYESIGERNEDLAQVHFHLGSIYFADKEYQLAITAFTKVQTYLGEETECIEIADALYFKGMAERALSQNGPALNSFNAALTLFQMLNDEDGIYNLKIANTYAQLGYVSKVMANHTYAISYFDQALDILGQDTNSETVAILHKCLGESALASNQIELATIHLTKAREMFGVMKNTEEQNASQTFLNATKLKSQTPPQNGSSSGSFFNDSPKGQAITRQPLVLNTSNGSTSSNEYSMSSEPTEDCCSWLLRCCGLFGKASPQQRTRSKEVHQEIKNGNVDVSSPLVQHLNGPEEGYGTNPLVKA